MTLVNPVHIAFIVAIALIVLGPKGLPEAARTLGNGMRELRETLNGVTRLDQPSSLTPRDEETAPRPSADAVTAAPGRPAEP